MACETGGRGNSRSKKSFIYYVDFSATKRNKCHIYNLMQLHIAKSMIDRLKFTNFEVNYLIN